MVGLIAAAILTAQWAGTRGPACLASTSTCEDGWGWALFSFLSVVITAIALGTVPGIAALTLTPAKKRPWRSLVVLVPATLVGFAAWLLLETHFHFGYSGVWWLITLFVLPSSTGLIAAWNVDKISRRLQLTPTK